MGVKSLWSLLTPVGRPVMFVLLSVPTPTNAYPNTQAGDNRRKSIGYRLKYLDLPIPSNHA